MRCLRCVVPLALAGLVTVLATDEVLAPYRGTHASAIVESVAEVARSAKENGGEVLDGPLREPLRRLSAPRR